MKTRILIEQIHYNNSTDKAYLVELPTNKKKYIWVPKKLLYPNWQYATLYVPLSKVFYGFDDDGNKFELTGNRILEYFSSITNIRNSYVR
ncbi:hypothetical protein [Ligilactobacillus equi]|uniref:hypothetical protein n=1 Tax=Ligilactobacillus equi TaxID=137357 RepID=UPI00054F17F2|nr:hypothetical protein [Ligilactobacillus equi]